MIGKSNDPEQKMEDFRPYKGVIVTSYPPVMFKTGNQILTNGGALYTNISAIYQQIETVIASTLWNWKKKELHTFSVLCFIISPEPWKMTWLNDEMKDRLVTWIKKQTNKKIEYKLVSILKIQLVIQLFPLFLPTFKVVIFFLQFQRIATTWNMSKPWTVCI